ncbi:MAG: hypothetical protein NTZ04_02545 [Chloroflexi bacterium]|nr:hypothetical protein [Chloroflexota bacterium]
MEINWFWYIGGLVAGFIAGGLFVDKVLNSKKNEPPRRQKFCPRCGESLEPK